MEHYTDASFCEGVRQRCRTLLTRYPELRSWVECRLALLEYVLDPPRLLYEQLRDLEVTLRSRERVAYKQLHQGNLEDALHTAAGLAEEAMEAVNAVTKQVLSPRAAPAVPMHANLMMPISRQRLSAANAVGIPSEHHERWNKNKETADSLWAGVGDANCRCLQIVAETRPLQHGGFWVPLARGETGEALPGASTAYAKMQGSAVFRHDLPHLDGFSGQVNRRWTAYMAEDFEHDLFVSVPLTLPMRGGHDVAAVVNVNVVYADDAPWFRAYHQEWLALLEQEVADFAEIAYHAAIVQLSAHAERQGAKLQLDTRAEFLLPQLPTALLLEADSSEVQPEVLDVRTD